MSRIWEVEDLKSPGFRADRDADFPEHSLQPQALQAMRGVGHEEAVDGERASNGAQDGDG